MRHAYIVIRSHHVIPALLKADADSLHGHFRCLLRPDVFTGLALSDRRLRTNYGFWSDDPWEDTPPPEAIRSPWVPGLGRLTISERAQLDHMAWRRAYGDIEFPPRATEEPEVDPDPADSEWGSPYWEGRGPPRPQANTFFEPRSSDGLDARIRAEGHTHRFSEDERLWHVPLSFGPRRKIACVPVTSAAEQLVRDGLAVAARAYVHLFTFGALTSSLAISLTSPVQREFDEFLGILQALVGIRTQPAFEFSTPQVDRCAAGTFVNRLAALLDRAAFEGDGVGIDKEPQKAILVREGDSTDESQMAGLLGLDDRYRDFRTDFLGAHGRPGASFYGKFETDTVLATRSSILVNVSPSAFSRAGARRFFWRVLQISELVQLEARLLDHTVSEQEAGALPEHTRAVLAAVGDVHRGLPAHHRKWYYRYGEVLRLDEAKAALRIATEKIERREANRQLADQIAGIGPGTISVENSQIGVLNLGTIAGSVAVKLEKIDSSGTSELAAELRDLAEAVLRCDLENDTERRVLLEGIEALTEEAAKDPGERRPAVIGAVMAQLGRGLEVSAALLEVWQHAEPVLHHAFGL